MKYLHKHCEAVGSSAVTLIVRFVGLVGLILLLNPAASIAQPLPPSQPESQTQTVRISGLLAWPDDPPAPTSVDSCTAYAIHKQGHHNSQFFTIDVQTKTTSALGPRHINYDIEGLDLHPTTGVLYASTGSDADGDLDGYLYTVDRQTGHLTPVGPSGFHEIVALSFRPTDGSLWGWSRSNGLIRLDTSTGAGVVEYASGERIEGLAWNPDGTLLFGAAGRRLLVYDPTLQTMQVYATNLPGTTEALEFRPDGLLVGGLHDGSTNSIYLYDVWDKRPTGERITVGYDDVEGIAWPENCGTPPPNPADPNEPDNTCINATQLLPGTFTESLLPTADDVDFFKVYVENPYTTVRVRLVHPDQDYDLALYDACIASGGVGWAFHVGQHRGPGQETVTYNVGPNGGWYYIQVVGFNGAHSPIPYTIEVSLLPPGPFGTLILTYRQRLAERYDAIDVQVLANKLSELALHPSVAGLIVDVGEDSAVRAAYQAWDERPESPGRANDVAVAIKRLVQQNLQHFPSIRYLVIVGSDEIIPFYRVPIRPYDVVLDFSWEKESTYLSAVGGEWDESAPTVAALRNNLTLTDDFYGADEGIRFQDHRLYLPNRAVGRLVETPQEMSAGITAYLATNGVSRPGRVLAVGSDFITDAADEACQLFSINGYGAVCRVDNGWNAGWLRENLLNVVPGIATVNSHAGHFGFLAPAGGLFMASDVAGASNPLDGLVFQTLGCQTGLNVPPANPQELDLAQAFVGRGATFAGNTGWSYGIVGGFGLSELLSKLFTEALVSGNSYTVGDALVDAKRNYYLRETDFDHYDEKILTEFTLYGLPMFQVQRPHELPAAQATALSPWMDGPELAASTDPTPARVHVTETTGGLTLELRELQFGGFEQRNEPWGSYYRYRGSVRADPGTPLQPRYMASTFASSGPVHGVALMAGSYTELSGFDPVVTMPLSPNSEVPDQEPRFIEVGWSPADFFGVRNLAGVLGDGTAGTLVLDLGQYNTWQGVERLYDRISVMLYRSDSTDWEPPQVQDIQVAPQGETSTITVWANDPSGLHAVLVAYTGQDNTWRTLSLAQMPGEMWQGILPADSELSFFVQVVDRAGNVAVDTNDGLYYRVCAPCGPARSLYLPLVAQN